ncbi:MAG: HD domain-containing protein [Caldithrix sp.]|nr:HD domain-containing protein [Caldithrix sp.]
METKELFQKLSMLAAEIDYDIYVVGGYVRDLQLGSPGKDIDFVVIGDAMRFADYLKKNLQISNLVQYQRFGTFMMTYAGYQLEFVNARKESYEDTSRKPQTQQADLYTDLSRRDFTINTLAMDISKEKYGEIIDVYDGIRDLKHGIIRTPLQPEQTFYDDPLRMMRAVRFATRFGFQIDSKIFEAIRKENERLSIVSQERITEEFNKILMANQPSRGLHLLDETELLQVFLPEMAAMKGVEQKKNFHHKDVFYHTLEVVDNIAEQNGTLQLRLAALLHDVGKPRTKRFDQESGWTFYGHEIVGERMANAILKRMRYSNEIIQYVKKLTKLHLRPMALVDEDVTDSAIRRVMFNAGEELEDLMDLCRADITSKNPQRVERFLDNYDQVVKKMAEVEERDRIRNFQPPVNGVEIMELFNLEAGPRVGKIKKFIENAILDGQVSNEHDACVEYLMQHKEELLD